MEGNLRRSLFVFLFFFLFVKEVIIVLNLKSGMDNQWIFRVWTWASIDLLFTRVGAYARAQWLPVMNMICFLCLPLLSFHLHLSLFMLFMVLLKWRFQQNSVNILFFSNNKDSIYNDNYREKNFHDDCPYFSSFLDLIIVFSSSSLCQIQMLLRMSLLCIISQYNKI